MGTNSRFIGIAIREADKSLYDWYKAQPRKASDVGRDMVEIAQLFDGNVLEAHEAKFCLDFIRELFGKDYLSELEQLQKVAEAM